MELTDEQLRAIELNKEKALQKLLNKRKNSIYNPQRDRIKSGIFRNKPTDKIPPLKGKVMVSTNIHSKTNKSVPLGKKYKISPELVSCSEFSVKGYYELRDMYRSVSGGRYRHGDWRFPLSSYNDFLSIFLKSETSVCEVERIPENILQYFTDKTFSSRKDCVDDYENISLEDVGYDLSHIDAKLRNALLPFQIYGLKYGIEKGGRVLLADDMGLGKTIQSLSIASFYRLEWPLLVISPASLLHSWVDSIIEWVPSIKERSIAIACDASDFSNYVVCIVSYEMAVKFIEEIKKCQYQVVIVDECHFLKNPSALRTKCILPVLKGSSRLLLLSGTPALSRPIELYTLTQALDRTLFPNVIEYGVRYCDAHEGDFGWEFKGASKTTELGIVLRETFMLRRMKRDVLKQLPAKKRIKVHFNLDSVSLKAYRDLASDFNINMDELQVEIKGMDPRFGNASHMRLWRETGVLKLSYVETYLKNLFEKDEETKYLVFGHHQQVIDGLEDIMWKNRIQFVRIDGKVNFNERQKICKEFQENPNIKAAILSITAAGVGLNLTSASVVIFTEIFWNPGLLIQAEDRAHRLGQKGSVTIHYLLAKETSDDILWPIVLGKLEVLESVGIAKNDLSLITESSQKEGMQTSILDFFRSEDV